MEEKKKRGRPKKVKLPDEVVSIVKEIIEDKEEQELESIHEFAEKIKLEHRKGKWDVPLDEPITFFDTSLSYEITGYKPINDKLGLDFKPEWFTEARDIKRRTGHYCTYHFGSKAYNEFWHEEYVRCREGLTVNGYTITGDHYFFLNYYQLMNNAETKKAGEGRFMDFPNFLVSLYEYLHYIEMCRRLRLNAVLMKARGLGFSEMNASIVSNQYSCRPLSMAIIAAADSGKLTPTLEKVWGELSFLNDETDGGFFKLRLALDKATAKRASHFKTIQGLKVEEGWMSQIIGIVADLPNKIRGYRTDLLVFEEAGSWPNLKKAFILGQALTGILGNLFGISIAGGTGGDKGESLSGLRDLYENPTSYNILPFKHNFTPDGSTVFTGYFLPAFSMVIKPGFIDSRGWTDPVKAKAWHQKERDKKAGDPKGLVLYQAEFCFTAEEAFALEGENKFNKVILANLQVAARVLKLGPPIQTGDLRPIYKGNSRDFAKDITDVHWVSDPNGLINIIEHPIWTEKYVLDTRELHKLEAKLLNVSEEAVEEIKDDLGFLLMSNLYVAGIDSIDMGNDLTSEETDDPSKFCITIKKRVRGMSNPMYVAYYLFRPERIRDAYMTAFKLMLYYNCMCNIEASRISMIQWAKNNGVINYFMRRPRATYPDPTRKQSNLIGTPATLSIIDHQTDLIANFIEDYGETIWFPDMLDLLIRYNDADKGKFDIVAAMAMTELADEELTGIVPKIVNEDEDSGWQDVGYYKDEKGVVHFGVIPKLSKYLSKTNIVTGFDNIVRSSNPRYFWGDINK